MGNLTPYILSEDARAQAAFYKQSLGGDIVSVITHGQYPDAKEEIKDKVMHLVLVLADGSTLYMTDSFEPFSRGAGGISLSLAFETEADARSGYTKLAEGGSLKYPLEQQPWGMFYGELQDKYGIAWMITADAKAS
jgi:PhnB protein